ncbi:oxygen-dependent coproporphyrinogen-III oxidase, chloroplastic-like [Zingiber officinale]|uniref:oxygen-dependent coproporphyrinogen-III oxidase, chloroplastic-like n=1 Tax=Zingiber officinale TaxID=94328 RepID=UPI001C4CA3E1|nr:oxygen-dependent coproporphyrinogen-III oxidase, chloroplastic-like [Zingiber officinale]
MPSAAAASVTATSSLFFVGQTLKPPALIRFRRSASTEVFSSRARFLRLVPVRAAVAIEKETPENERPETFLREADGSHSAAASASASVRARFERMIREAQDEVCAAIEEADGGGTFREDVWSRPGGGGGISRVLQDGAVWEKAGVNVSVVYGIMPPEAYRAAKGEAGATDGSAKAGPVPFFAAGISSVLHPKNPFAPTLHFNYRYFETDAPKDAPGAPRQWWFGGGTDFTPAYIFEEDVKHFHMIQKQACDKFDPSFYPRFKKWCDDYFIIKHRNERRGLGGIFFDDLNNYDQEMLLAFSTECTKSVVPAYIPIIERRKNTPFNEQHKEWQQLRRGRYVEFNLVYDRGTTFGLKTGGRIESILVSLPLTARWEYDHQPEEGTEEWKLLDACKNPKEWL